MKFDFDEIIDRRGTNSMEYDVTDEYMAEFNWGPVPADFIPIDVADMDFRCAPCIRTALQKVVDFNLYGYCFTHPSLHNGYYEAIIGWYARRHDWYVKREEILYSAGTLTGITAAIKAVSGYGDSILVTPPVYTPFYSTIRNADRKVVKSHLLDNDGYYTVNWEDFEKKTALAEVKAFLLCSPHNPVGRVWTADELKRIYNICTKNDVVVIADEIHGDIVRRETVFTPIGKITDAQNLIVCAGASKSFNLASLEASHLIIKDKALRCKTAEQLHCNPTPFVLEAVKAAYNEGEEWFEQLREYLDENIDFVIAFLKENMPEVKVWRPEGTYLLWMDFSAYGLSDDELLDRCYNKAGVFVEQGRDFDEGGSPGYIRVCTSIPRIRLEEAFSRICSQFK